MFLSSLSVSISAVVSGLLLIWGRFHGQERLAVHLEFILFCLTQGSLEEAHQAALSYDFSLSPELMCYSSLTTGFSFNMEIILPLDLNWE